MGKIQAGNLLVADPSLLTDEVFGRSVIILTEITLDAISGFILNKPLPIFLSDLLVNYNLNLSDDMLVYMGGPVNPDLLYFIHTSKVEIKDSTPIGDGYFLGNNIDVAISLITRGVLSQNDIRFFLGYSGWGFKQLDRELKDNSWVVVNPQPDVFRISNSEIWKKFMKSIGGNYAIWANAPENIEMN